MSCGTWSAAYAVVFPSNRAVALSPPVFCKEAEMGQAVAVSADGSLSVTPLLVQLLSAQFGRAFIPQC